MQMLLRIPLYRRQQRRPLLLNPYLPLRRNQRRHPLLNPRLQHLQPRQFLPHPHRKSLLCMKQLPHQLHRKMQLLPHRKMQLHPHRIMQLRLRRNKPWHRIRIWKLPARTSTSLQGNCAVPAKELMIYRETG